MPQYMPHISCLTMQPIDWLCPVLHIFQVCSSLFLLVGLLLSQSIPVHQPTPWSRSYYGAALRLSSRYVPFPCYFCACRAPMFAGFVSDFRAKHHFGSLSLQRAKMNLGQRKMCLHDRDEWWKKGSSNSKRYRHRTLRKAIGPLVKRKRRSCSAWHHIQSEAVL